MKAHQPQFSLKRVRHQAFLVFVGLLSIFIVNGIFLSLVAQSDGVSRNDTKIEQVSQALQPRGARTYDLSRNMKKNLKASHKWVMLIANDGDVVYSYNKPQDVPDSYTLSDVAAFSRWYLNDYPVDVWKHSDGLLVLGSPKTSLWKFLISEQMGDMWLLPFAIVLNIFLLLLVTYVIVRLNAYERDKARTEWIAAVSHDTRTPLQLVMAHSDDIARKEDISAEVRQRAESIMANAHNVAQLISNLNMANRLAYAAQPLHTEKTRISAAVRAAVAQILNGGIDDKFDISLEFSDDAQTAVAYIDKALFARMVTNVMTNSIKHNPHGCTITLHGEVHKKRWVWGKNHFVLTIRDNGVGYPAQILNDFKNLDSRYTRSVSKTLPEHGLGLLIVSRIASAHGGSVQVMNDERGSSKTVIQMPCA